MLKRKEKLKKKALIVCKTRRKKLSWGKKVGKAVCAIGSIVQDLHKTERERELDKGGMDGREEEKTKQEDRINVGRVCTTAGKPEC